jgi:hypothetical protein
VALGSLLVNRKRKLRFQDGAKFLKTENACAKEIAKAIAELTRLVGSTLFIGEREANQLEPGKELNNA